MHKIGNFKSQDYHVKTWKVSIDTLTSTCEIETYKAPQFVLTQKQVFSHSSLKYPASCGFLDSKDRSTFHNFKNLRRSITGSGCTQSYSQLGSQQGKKNGVIKWAYNKKESLPNNNINEKKNKIMHKQQMNLERKLELYDAESVCSFVDGAFQQREGEIQGLHVSIAIPNSLLGKNDYRWVESSRN